MLTDVLKRYQSFKDGQDAPPPIMLTGTDEHGAKIQKAAEAKGCEPKDLCDQVSVRFKVSQMDAALGLCVGFDNWGLTFLTLVQELADAAHVDYDVFFRTTEERHAKAVQHAWVSWSRWESGRPQGARYLLNLSCHAARAGPQRIHIQSTVRRVVLGIGRDVLSRDTGPR